MMPAIIIYLCIYYFVPAASACIWYPVAAWCLAT
jgi:hypothetical protein